MIRSQILLIFFSFLIFGAALSAGQDVHLTEPGSGVAMARSAFAHGYRHGYEEGYHHGNVDANMGRPPQAKLDKLRGLSMGYDSSFGAKKSFEAGFRAGLQAGYGDGFAGRSFRAVTSCRELGKALDAASGGGDPSGTYFDRGLSTGYSDGFERTVANPSGAHQLLDSIPCARFSPGKKSDAMAETSYCEGYRRGYSLGRTDALELGGNRAALEAAK